MIYNAGRKHTSTVELQHCRSPVLHWLAGVVGVVVRVITVAAARKGKASMVMAEVRTNIL